MKGNKRGTGKRTAWSEYGRLISSPNVRGTKSDIARNSFYLIVEAQKISFMPSCNCRELPRSPRVERVAVIWPKVDAVSEFCGCVKFGWFNRLNASARNCSEMPSLMLVFFAMEKSTSWNPGEVRMLRPALPNPRLCLANAFGLIHCEGEGLGTRSGWP